MKLSELNDLVLDLAAGHFTESSVLWAEQYTPQHPLPQTTLKMKDASIPRHPVNIVKEDGINCSYYECTKILEVNRYADSVGGNGGEIASLENPAVDDMAGFLLFLQSDLGIERMYAANICIEAMGQVRDLSELDRTHYRYRAMQEYTVRFILEYENGRAEVYRPPEMDAWEPVVEPIGYFNEVEIETEDIYE